MLTDPPWSRGLLRDYEPSDGPSFQAVEPRHLLLLVLHVAPVPEACAAPPPVRDVDGGGEGQEAEPAEVVAAVPVHHTHRLQTPPHLHVLVAAVSLHLALAGVGEALRGQPPQRLWQPRSKLGIKIQ